jgi:hypothetical protein
MIKLLIYEKYGIILGEIGEEYWQKFKLQCFRLLMVTVF